MTGRTRRIPWLSLTLAFAFLLAFGVDSPAQPEGMEAIPPELIEQLRAMAGQATVGQPASSDIDLAALKKRHENAVVKIEFTGVMNQEQIKMNPTKSEDYWSGSEPPHGTGFFISEREILTNAHVVEETRRGSIRVKSPATGNVEFKVEIVGVGTSERIDLAVLRLPEDEIMRFKKRSGLLTIPHLEFGDSDRVKQADPLAIFGYPQSSDELKLIQGKVTGRQYLKLATGRFVCGHQFLEVGPAGVVQPGNSGGPALNRDGEVVGVPSRGSWGGEQGWLIPSDIVVHFLDRIRGNEEGRLSLRLPTLGITLTENFPGTAVWTGAPEDCVIFELGVVVREVTTGSLARQWGIEPGDILVGFANRQKGLSCALDFEGYRVITGKMKHWPPPNAGETPPQEDEGIEPAKLHLAEMILTSDEGDDVTLWLVRKGEEGYRKIERRMQYVQPVPLPHLGPFEKPDFHLWADFVAQDFNDYNVALFEAPVRELLAGGALITYVEPNSLASRRGMMPNHRSIYGFSFSFEFEAATSWFIIESVNDTPVRNLADLKAALAEAEARFEAAKAAPGYDPARRILTKERYVQIGFRTNTYDGNVIHMKPAFPVDEALECRENVRLTP